MHVIVVGLGTLGSRLVKLLSNGQHRITGIDRDIVMSENIQNQTYFQEDIGLPKPLALAKQYDIVPICDELNEETIEYLRNADVIIDGLDNMPTRQLIGWYAAQHNIPYIYGAAAGNMGCVARFKETHFSDVFVKQAQGLTCSSEGITAQAADWVAQTQVQLLDSQEERLLYYNEGDVAQLNLPQHTSKPELPLVKTKAVKLCGRNLWQTWINTEKAKELCQDQPFYKNENCTIFPNGRVLVQANEEAEVQKRLNSSTRK